MNLEQVHITLKDGTPILIRTVCPHDRYSLLAMHERLSDHSLQMRYMSMARLPLVNQIERICHVDPGCHFALVAVSCSVNPGQIVAVAEYAIPDQSRPGIAEVGIVVEDTYQHKGLGSSLLIQLVRNARMHDICELIADVAYENQAILAFVRKTILPHRSSLCDGLIHVSIELPCEFDTLEHILARNLSN